MQTDLINPLILASTKAIFGWAMPYSISYDTSWQIFLLCQTITICLKHNMDGEMEP